MARASPTPLGRPSRAQAKIGAYFQFFHAVKEAEGAAAVGWLAKIERAANDGRANMGRPTKLTAG